MGLGQTGNKIYLNVAEGKIIQKVDEKTPGAVSFTKEDKSVIYQLKHSYIEGFLTGITVISKEFNGKSIKQWALDIEDGSSVYQLQLPYSSGYAASMLKALLNPVMDFNLPVKFTPWAKVVNDKKKTSIYVRQKEEDIPWYFTKDEPNGLPPMKQVEFKGEKKWDDYDMMQFLEAQVKAKIVPQLYKSSKGSGKPDSAINPSEQSNVPVSENYSPSNAPEEDDLPF